MLGWLKKLLAHDGNRTGVFDDPRIHYFPDLGPNGEVTIDCIVRASAWTYGNKTGFDKNTDGWVPRISPACVGAVLVEVDEYGLRFRWEARKAGNDVFLSPFGRPPFRPPRTQPTADGTE